MSANPFLIHILGAVSPHLSQTNFRGVPCVTLVTAFLGVHCVTLLFPRLSRQSPVYAVLDALAGILLENVHIVIERLMGNVHEMVSRIKGN